jgi:methionine sulfoxide reductase heme-binding subunit
LTGAWTKGVVFAACLAPLAWLASRALDHNLTSDPVAYLTHFSGDWTLRFLVLTLAVTPLRNILHLPELTRYRRMLGLFAFFYACLHFTTWVWLDHSFHWSEMWQDVLKRRFITVGCAAFLLLIPLAITSTAGWMRRLGGKRWRRLHRLIYGIAVLGVVHYYWLVKSDVRNPVGYGVLVMLLLGWRLRTWLRGRDGARPGPVGREAPVTAETI